MKPAAAPLTLGEELLRESGFPAGGGSAALQGVYNPRKLSMTIFPRHGERCVAKIATGGTERQRLAREAGALETIHGAPEFRPAARLAPKPILHRESGRMTLHVQEFLPGMNLYEQFLLEPPKGWNGLARALRPVLELLNDPLPAGCEAAPGARTAEWVPALEELLPAITDDEESREGIRSRLRAVLASFTGRRTAFWQHGDFFMKNVLVDSGRIRLVDWEDFSADWPPLFDLYEFVLTLHPWRQGPGYRDQRIDLFRRIVRGTNPLSRLFRRTESMLWETWQLPAGHTREDYLLLAIAIQARRIHDRLGMASIEYEILSALGRHVGRTILRGDGSLPGTTPPKPPA